MGTPAPALTDFEDIQLSPEDLQRLTLGGPVATVPHEVKAAEDSLPTKERRKLKALQTGHKIKIISEVKAGFPIKEICERAGISPAALMIICNDPVLMEITNTQHLALTKKFQAARFYHISDMALNEITPEKLANLDPYRLAMVAAIMTDKGRLIEGQSTENISFKSLAFNIHTTWEQLKERKTLLMANLQGRALTSPHNAPANATILPTQNRP